MGLGPNSRQALGAPQSPFSLTQVPEIFSRPGQAVWLDVVSKGTQPALPIRAREELGAFSESRSHSSVLTALFGLHGIMFVLENRGAEIGGLHLDSKHRVLSHVPT